MTSTEIISIIGAVGVLIGVLTPAILSIIKALADVRTIVDRVDGKADVIAATAASINGHVNSEKTAGEGRENTLRAENVMLREVIAEKKITASLLAQAAAGATTTVVQTTNGPLTPQSGHADDLKKIEANTKDTATNTAKTDVAIQEIKAEQEP